jgi:outer membrane receptor protein involved in Fe transport
VGALPIQKLLNGDVNNLGAEAELRTRPAAFVEDYIGLWALLFPTLVTANFGWLDSTFGDFVVTKSVTAPRGGGSVEADFDYTGNQLVAAPEWNFSVVAENEIPLFGWGSLIPQYDFSYRSKAYLDPAMIDPISQDGYWLHNARIAYRTPDERIELAFWVANLFDEEYKVDVFDLTRDYNTILEVWGEPRMYGVTLSLNW